MNPEPPPAEQHDFPAGTLGALLALMDDHPDWDVAWTSARKAGFRASRQVKVTVHTSELGAETPEVLREQIEAVHAELERLARPDVAPGLTVQVEDGLGHVQASHHWPGRAGAR